MSRVMKTVPLVVLCALIIAVPSVWAYWAQDGVALCVATDSQDDPMIVSDGAGGAIVTWRDSRSGSGNSDIYAQRVNASGAVQWTADGVALCAATWSQAGPAITADGAGGAIVAWLDYRSGGSSYDIYAQRVNASGTVQWTADGVACTATGYRLYPIITSDGAGGAIVMWSMASSENIYAQRINASGVVQWTTDGVPICTAANNQRGATITSDGAGGAIVTWQDNRGGYYYNIYAQRVNASGAVQWTANGVAIRPAPSSQQGSPTITSDGAGGAIVTWVDLRGSSYDIYAQRVNASGAAQWAADGVALCTATNTQIDPAIISEDAGGAIVTWRDDRSGSSYDIYAQRVDASGAVQWAANGVALCTATGDQGVPTIAADGAGGAIVTWWDYRSGSSYDIYAQRVDASGAVQWTVDGVVLREAIGSQQSPGITSDGASGAIVTWYDNRGGTNDIYAQSVSAHGRVGYHAPYVLAIQDVPHDQGGLARIRIGRSVLDDVGESDFPVLTYNVWQRIDSPALLAMVARANESSAVCAPVDEVPPESAVDPSSASGWPLTELYGRYFVQSKNLLGAGDLPSGAWELVGSFAACQQSQYIYRAGTLVDSTASGIPYSVYFVSAHTTTPSVWFASDPDSGYSVDNLPPETPEGLAAEQEYSPPGLSLSWTVNSENDLAHYAVYRGSSEDFVPSVVNLLATPMSSEYVDAGWSWSEGYYYKVSAVDVHGNESGFALLRPDDVTGSETPKVPEASYLAQNFPNPFNPMTKLAFGLSAPGRVSLRIYEASGRLVRELVNETRPAARYEEVWDGRDGAGRLVASGAYFYRLEAGSFTQTRKMILLR